MDRHSEERTPLCQLPAAASGCGDQCDSGVPVSLGASLAAVCPEPAAWGEDGAWTALSPVPQELSRPAVEPLARNRVDVSLLRCLINAGLIKAGI